MNFYSKLSLTALAVMLSGALTVPAAAPETKRSTGPQVSVAAKKPSWTDPDQIMPSLKYDGIPLAEVVEHLREQFKNQFDVVPPSIIHLVNPATGVGEGFDALSMVITLRLQNVKASEIFNAMNLLFEANGDPVRWELLMNGTRSTAVLRLARADESEPARPVPEPVKRTVFFVGDIVDDQLPGKLSWREFSKTVEMVCSGTFDGSSLTVATHPGAGLFVVSGTQEEVEFVQNMLEALKEKAKLDTERKAQSTSTKPAPQSADSAKR